MKRPVTTFERFLDAQDEQALYLLWKDEKINTNGQATDETNNIVEQKSGDITDNIEQKNGDIDNNEVKNGISENLLKSSQNGLTNVLLGYLKVIFLVIFYNLKFHYLKIVRDRRLYLINERSRRYVHTPICILDFFIHPSVQHHGCGLELFNAMLKVD
jgi:hypothetical protein